MKNKTLIAAIMMAGSDFECNDLLREEALQVANDLCEAAADDPDADVFAFLALALHGG